MITSEHKEVVEYIKQQIEWWLAENVASTLKILETIPQEHRAQVLTQTSTDARLIITETIKFAMEMERLNNSH